MLWFYKPCIQCHEEWFSQISCPLPGVLMWPGRSWQRHSNQAYWWPVPLWRLEKGAEGHRDTPVSRTASHMLKKMSIGDPNRIKSQKSKVKLKFKQMGILCKFYIKLLESCRYQILVGWSINALIDASWCSSLQYTNWYTCL